MKRTLGKIILAIFLVGVIGYIGIGVLFTSIFGCKKTATLSDGAKPTVTVTIEPYRYFVEQIAGDKVKVNVMVPAGSNPETYEPTAQQMLQLSLSSLYFKVGRIGFEETWMKKLTDNAPDMKVIDTSKGISPAKTAGGVIDPHVWMSTTSAAYITSNICKALCEMMPEDSAYFVKRKYEFASVTNNVAANLTFYLKNAKEAREKLTRQKVKRIPFVIYHPALTYFAKDHGLNQYPIEEEGREPSIAQLQSLIDKAKHEQIKTVFIQREFANRNTQTFIDATHSHPIEINPLAYNWEREMISIAKKMARSYGDKREYGYDDSKFAARNQKVSNPL